MFAQRSFSADAYKRISVETEVQTADPHRLIVLLLDAATIALSEALVHIETNQIGKKGACISKAIDIIANGLKVSIDREAGGELAARLIALYDYMSTRLLHANMRNDTAAIKEVITLLGEIHVAWTQIGQTTAAEHA